MHRLGALREPNFRRLWIGQTTSAFGDALAGVALTFGILGTTGSAVDLGLVLTAFMVPRVVFLLVGGVWADRVPRRTIMLSADLVRAAAQAVLAIAFLTGGASLPVFIAVAVVTGAARRSSSPPRSAWCRRRSARSASSRPTRCSTCRSRSPPWRARSSPALLLVTIGPGWIFAIDGLSFVVSAVALAVLRLPALPPIASRPFLADLAIGWREVVSRSWLIASLAGFAFVNLAFAGFFVIAPVIVERSYAGAPDWGVLMAGFGLGGPDRRRAGAALVAARPLVAVFAILLAAPLTLLLLAGLPPLRAARGRGGRLRGGDRLRQHDLAHDAPAPGPGGEHLAGQLLRLDGVAALLPDRLRAWQGRCRGARPADRAGRVRGRLRAGHGGDPGRAGGACAATDRGAGSWTRRGRPTRWTRWPPRPHELRRGGIGMRE